MSRRSRFNVIWAVSVCTMLVAVLSACAPAKLPAPALAVDRLLELRSTNASDPAEYRRVVESTRLAEALAADSAKRAKTGQKPTPEWERPVVKKLETSTAEVRIVWKQSEKFKDWPASTVFVVTRSGGAWHIVDAVNSTETAK